MNRQVAAQRTRTRLAVMNAILTDFRISKIESFPGVRLHALAWVPFPHGLVRFSTGEVIRPVTLARAVTNTVKSRRSLWWRTGWEVVKQ